MYVCVVLGQAYRGEGEKRNRKGRGRCYLYLVMVVHMGDGGGWGDAPPLASKNLSPPLEPKIRDLHKKLGHQKKGEN